MPPIKGFFFLLCRPLSWNCTPSPAPNPTQVGRPQRLTFHGFLAFFVQVLRPFFFLTSFFFRVPNSFPFPVARRLFFQKFPRFLPGAPLEVCVYDSGSSPPVTLCPCGPLCLCLVFVCLGHQSSFLCPPSPPCTPVPLDLCRLPLLTAHPMARGPRFTSPFLRCFWRLRSVYYGASRGGPLAFLFSLAFFSEESLPPLSFFFMFLSPKSCVPKNLPPLFQNPPDNRARLSVTQMKWGCPSLRFFPFWLRG